MTRGLISLSAFFLVGNREVTSKKNIVLNSIHSKNSNTKPIRQMQWEAKTRRTDLHEAQGGPWISARPKFTPSST